MVFDDSGASNYRNWTEILESWSYNFKIKGNPCSHVQLQEAGAATGTGQPQMATAKSQLQADILKEGGETAQPQIIPGPQSTFQAVQAEL